MNTKKVTNTGVVYDLPDGKEVKEEKKGKKKVTKSGEVYEEPVKKPVSKPEEEEEQISNNATSEPSDEYKRGFQAALEMVKQQQAQQA